MPKKANSFVRYIFVICLALVFFSACHRQVPKRILFIGNSYTFVNGGIDKQFEGLAPSTQTVSLAFAGFTLEKHLTNGSALQTIRQGGWDYVILQDQSQTPVINRKKFYDAAQKLDEEIRRSGAKTVLLMTWERPDSAAFGVTTDNLAAAYYAAGMGLGVKVAPAGLAFARSISEKPELVLYSKDGHPTMAGTYLAACVLYGTIFGRSPVGNNYFDKSIPKETREYLQRISFETLGY